MGAHANNDLEQLIITTARDLFITQGFDGTSMSDIAAKTGITRPTLHYYYRTKEKMFQAVFGSIVANIAPRLQEIITQDIPLIDRLGLIIDEYFAKFTETPTLPKFIIGEINRDPEHLLKSACELHLDSYVKTAQKVILSEMEAGHIRTVPIPTIFLTFFSLLTYPFLIPNLLSALFRTDPTIFLPTWKQHILEQMTSMLSLED